VRQRGVFPRIDIRRDVEVIRIAWIEGGQPRVVVFAVIEASTSFGEFVNAPAISRVATVEEAVIEIVIVDACLEQSVGVTSCV
jgi:hypothetical protein